MYGLAECASGLYVPPVRRGPLVDRVARLPCERDGHGANFAALRVGSRHTCGLTTAGVAYCWGDNGTGQLGDGTSQTVRLTPVRVVQ